MHGATFLGGTFSGPVLVHLVSKALEYLFLGI